MHGRKEFPFVVIAGVGFPNGHSNPVRLAVVAIDPVDLNIHQIAPDNIGQSVAVSTSSSLASIAVRSMAHLLNGDISIKQIAPPTPANFPGAVTLATVFDRPHSLRPSPSGRVSSWMFRRTIAGYRKSRFWNQCPSSLLERSYSRRRPMPGDPKECRRHALTCVRLAQTSPYPQARQQFADLAKRGLG